MTPQGHRKTRQKSCLGSERTYLNMVSTVKSRHKIHVKKEAIKMKKIIKLIGTYLDPVKFNSRKKKYNNFLNSFMSGNSGTWDTISLIIDNVNKQITKHYLIIRLIMVNMFYFSYPNDLVNVMVTLFIRYKLK